MTLIAVIHLWPEGGLIVLGQIDFLGHIDSNAQFTRTIKPKMLGHSLAHFSPTHFTLRSFSRSFWVPSSFDQAIKSI